MSGARQLTFSDKRIHTISKQRNNSRHPVNGKKRKSYRMTIGNDLYVIQKKHQVLSEKSHFVLTGKN